MTSPSPQSPLQVKPMFPGWRMASSEIEKCRPHVSIDQSQIPAVLPWLTPGPVNQAWRAYISPIDPAALDLSRIFFELALTISQFGGFIGYGADGSLDTWKRDGSGVKAILATMAAIRSDKKLPGIDIHDNYERELAHYFVRAPFGRQRLQMLQEIATPNTRRFFKRHIATARRKDGSFEFNILHMIGLGCRFPLSFGEDPVFYKKASLLLLTMEIALNQLGETAISQTLPPADYRIPQILEGLGILRFTDDVTRKICSGNVFRITDPEVCAIRAMTVEAVGHIKSGYERHYGTQITCAELDGLLYLLSRNRPLMARASMKPHMLVATAAF